MRFLSSLGHALKMNPASNRIRTLDGLRGLSIILVFLNHLGLGFFRGGYVGVDVFFVISGYVITRSIRDHRADSDFLSSFYERRIRRLFPSLVITILCCYVMALVFFEGADRLAINSSILPSVLGFSNFIFYKQAGYFDETSIEKPLLHTWSLSVEEQFYITYALLIFLLHKPVFKRRLKPMPALRGILLLTAAASLLLSACVTNKHPSFSYFLIPTRFWEIGVGCLASWYSWKLPVRWDRWLPALGLGAIIASSFWFDSETPYPGVAAVLPTFGVLLLILGQQNEGFLVNRILSSRCLTYSGDISYALYLVHWPVIVFATTLFPAGLSLFAKMIIVSLSVFAASLMTFQIENPIRQKRFLRSRRSLFSLAGCGAGTIALIFLSTVILTPKPAHRLSLFVQDSVLDTILPNSGGEWLWYGTVNPSLVETVGADKTANTAVWGDSHAMNLLDGLVVNATNSGLSFKFFVDYSTPPVLGLGSENAGSEAYGSNVLAYLIGHQEITNVILTANWTAYLEGAKYFGHPEGDSPDFNYLGEPVKDKEMAYKVFAQQLEATVSALSDANKKVFICTPVPTYAVNISKAVRILQMTGRNPNSTLGYSLDIYSNVNANLLGTFARIRHAHPNVTIIPLQVFLSQNGTSLVADGPNSLYYDAHHLNSYGSLFIGRRVSQIVAGH